jgi:uncharacterized protein with PIN domain
MKFLCDQMLGTLAKWLRIYGFDTFYAKRDMKDLELLELSKKENRVIITKDKDLVYNARREQIKVIKIQTTNLDDQIKNILENTKLEEDSILTRCLTCNTLLCGIDKKNVKNKVPPKVFENHTEFLFCNNCKKIYWKGTHYKKMLEKVGQYL